MNDEFLNTAFSSSERKKIATVTIKTHDNSEYGTDGGDSTQDMIFALSADEAKKYFKSNSDRKAYTTDYLHTFKCDHDDRTDYWWLRTPGEYSDDASDVHYVGSINQKGYKVDYAGTAARPAFWLILD